MFDELNICPYTGLRSFTEEESIYFKGRDEHIQEATAQLELNKFLMLTGASGDGKSSIVYAGIIPNARAGFLKATYTNWKVADFRPERNPFQNLCTVIGNALGIKNIATVESELQHGFSALIDLYKSSPLYVDKTSSEYHQLTDEERKKLQYSTANLLILVDQFEEFFTNPENYANGVPSTKANLTMNLLLESAKIAREEGIPIYIVFTMRSDFIGQCAAFRGLPEFIGFSQFFVPRLNRKLLQEVIEEPCTLSGNRITRRLSERIIHDMNDGIDQLPILQHALNQIWKAADNGKEEMDLIHYAMVGGLAAEELPLEDQEKFKNWFKQLPKNIQGCFHDRTLHNVLDTHANKIFESAASYVKEKSNIDITEEKAHEIIRVTFTSLTKIDQSRAVRNRMTLEEINAILNEPSIDLAIISGIINIFREPGNTFIRPFILDDPSTDKLNADSVLDITHESLIRNWNMLKIWAKEEFTKFSIFKDFKQQVDRWLQHSKSSGFLLPIGSLTFFENWYYKSRINKNWVNRYNEQVTDTPKNIAESEKIVKDSNDFLRLSARKHAFSRAIVRLGPRKVFGLISILLFLSLSSFLYYNNLKQSNEYVRNVLYSNATQLLIADKATYNVKADYLIARDREQPGKFKNILNTLETTNENRLGMAIATAEDIVYYDRQGTAIPLKKQSILYADSIATVLYTSVPKDASSQNLGLISLLNLGEIIEYYLHYFTDAEMEALQANNGKMLTNLVLHLTQNPNENLDFRKWIESIEMGLNYHHFSIPQIELLIKTITSNEPAIQAYFDKEKVVQTNKTGDSYSFNGKYFILAELYAALGNPEQSMAMIDTTLKYNPRSIDYATNGLSVAGYFLLYDHLEAMDLFVTNYAARVNFKPYEIYRQIANRSGYVTQSIDDRILYPRFALSSDLWYNPVLDYMQDNAFEKLYEVYLNAINTTADVGGEHEFSLAIYYKQKGLFTAKRNENKKNNRKDWIADVNVLFKNALIWYAKTDNQYLDEEVNAYFHFPTVMSRRQIFTYPDHIEHVPSHAERTRYSRYFSSVFLEYLIEQREFDTMYPTAIELKQPLDWVKEYKTALISYGFNYDGNPVHISILQKIDSAILHHTAKNEVNNNLLLLLMAKAQFEALNPNLAIEYAKRIKLTAIPGLFNEEQNFLHHKTLNLIAEVHSALVINNQFNLAHNLRAALPHILNKIRLADKAAIDLFVLNKNELANNYLDSATMLISTTSDHGNGFQNYRKTHGYALALKGEKDSFKQSNVAIRNLNDFFRTMGYIQNVRATAFRGHFYKAYSELPKFYSANEQLATINAILSAKAFYAKEEEWEAYDYSKNYSHSILGYD